MSGTERYCRSRASMSCGALVSSSCKHCAQPAAAHRWAAPAPSALRRASRGAVPALASRRTPSQCARPCPWAQQRSSGVHPERFRACCDCGAHSTSSWAQAIFPSSHARCSNVDLSVVPGSGALAAATSRGSRSEASDWMRPSRTACSRARMDGVARPGGWFPRRSSFPHSGDSAPVLSRASAVLATATGWRRAILSPRSPRSFVRGRCAGDRLARPDSLSSLNVHLVAAAVTVISARLSSRQQRYV